MCEKVAFLSLDLLPSSVSLQIGGLKCPHVLRITEKVTIVIFHTFDSFFHSYFTGLPRPCLGLVSPRKKSLLSGWFIGKSISLNAGKTISWRIDEFLTDRVETATAPSSPGAATSAVAARQAIRERAWEDFVFDEGIRPLLSAGVLPHTSSPPWSTPGLRSPRWSSQAAGKGGAFRLRGLHVCQSNRGWRPVWPLLEAQMWIILYEL